MPSMQILVLALIALGTIVGTVDVISVAFAEQQGQPAAASIVLSVYAFGSCLAGLIFGAIKIPRPLASSVLIRGIRHRLHHPAAAVGAQCLDAGGGDVCRRIVLRRP